MPWTSKPAVTSSLASSPLPQPTSSTRAPPAMPAFRSRSTMAECTRSTVIWWVPTWVYPAVTREASTHPVASADLNGSGLGCIGTGLFQAVQRDQRSIDGMFNLTMERRSSGASPSARAAAVDVGQNAVVPRILRIADPRAGVGDRSRRHAARLQHGQRRDAGAVLARTGVVEEHRGQRHLECECPRARPAVRAADDDRAGVVRCELGDRIDDDHAAAGAAHNFLLDHIRLR